MNRSRLRGRASLVLIASALALLAGLSPGATGANAAEFGERQRREQH